MTQSSRSRDETREANEAGVHKEVIDDASHDLTQRVKKLEVIGEADDHIVILHTPIHISNK
jgi:hypothetical protein